TPSCNSVSTNTAPSTSLGSSSQRYMVARGVAPVNPAARHAAIPASRRSVNVATFLGTKSLQLSSAATPAACTAMNCPVSRNDFTLANAATNSGRPTAQPQRHPVMLYVLERDVTRAVDLENARRPIAIECQLRVRIVIHEQEIQLATAPHDAFEIVERR